MGHIDHISIIDSTQTKLDLLPVAIYNGELSRTISELTYFGGGHIILIGVVSGKFGHGCETNLW